MIEVKSKVLSLTPSLSIFFDFKVFDWHAITPCCQAKSTNNNRSNRHNNYTSLSKLATLVLVFLHCIIHACLPFNPCQVHFFGFPSRHEMHIFPPKTPAAVSLNQSERSGLPEEGVMGAATRPLTLKAAMCCICAAAIAAMGFR